MARDPATFVVSAHGDVDSLTAPELENELLEAIQLGARHVVVDLTETTFFDSSAIHALLRSGELLQASGLQLSVVCCTPNIKKILEITGVDQILQIHATIEQAISLTGGGRRANTATDWFAAQVRQRQAFSQLGADLRRRIAEAGSPGDDQSAA